MLGNGDGTFELGITSPVLDGMQRDLVADDFNGDGILDMAVPIIEEYYDGYSISILLGNGDGTFSQAEEIDTDVVDRIFTGDVNGDGIVDLAASGFYSGVRVLLGNGDGSFEVQPAMHIAAACGVTIGDFNGDGFADLAVANNFPHPFYSAAVLLGNGDGSFTSPQFFATAKFPCSIETADFNGDGVTDLITAASGSQVCVLHGVGDGTFLESQNFDVIGNGEPTTGDFDGDGDIDIASAGLRDVVTVLLNQTNQPILLGDVNNDGVVDLLDVAPFVELVMNSEFLAEADINLDGSVNLLDIAPFVKLLANN